MSIIKTEHLVHNYIIKTSTMDINTIHVLKDIDFEVEKGNSCRSWDVQDVERVPFLNFSA